MKITDLLGESIVDEISLGDYTRKAKLSQASHAMSNAFGHDQSPETKAKHQHKINRHEVGLGRAKARSDKWAAEREAKARADHENAVRSKYAGVDIDAEIAKLKPAIDRAYHDYQYGARNTYSQAHDEYNRLRGKAQELERAKKILGGLSESASDGATNAANVGVGAVYKNKPPKQPKNKDGTAKNALDMKGTNLLTGGSIKRS